MNISLEDIASELEFFNIKVEQDEILEDKVQGVCMDHEMDEDMFTKEFVSFALKDKSRPAALPLSKGTLQQFEKELLRQKSSTKGKETVTKTNPKPFFAPDDMGDLNLLSAYATPDNKTLIKVEQRTPRATSNKKTPRVVSDSSPGLSRLMQSPSGTQYSTRTSTGNVVQAFGDFNSSEQSESPRKTTIDLLTAPSDGKNIKYMFQKIGDKAQVLNDMIEDAAALFTKQYDVSELAHIVMPSQDPVRVCGRVCCDSVGRLNAQSVLLEGSRESSAGRSVPVDLDAAPQYSLFPGQVTMLEGSNASGKGFAATQVFSGPPSGTSPEHPVAEDGLSVLVACGPYTPSNSLSYEPLADLLKQLEKQTTDVCILLGPFVDVKHKELELCSEPLETLFKACMEEINEMQKRTGVRFIIVPSLRDAHHHFVYPCPPFTSAITNNEMVDFVLEPSTVNINGLVVSLSSTDTLMHLSAEEISHGIGGDRISRLIGHLLSQRSFYPLYPAHEDVPLDHGLQELYGQLPHDFKPHVIILPSDLKHYVKDVDGVCAVNPGRLVKGAGGGTFARLAVAPLTPNNRKTTAIQRIAVQVTRI